MKKLITLLVFVNLYLTSNAQDYLKMGAEDNNDIAPTYMKYKFGKGYFLTDDPNSNYGQKLYKSDMQELMYGTDAYDQYRMSRNFKTIKFVALGGSAIFIGISAYVELNNADKNWWDDNYIDDNVASDARLFGFGFLGVATGFAILENIYGKRTVKFYNNKGYSLNFGLRSNGIGVAFVF